MKHLYFSFIFLLFFGTISLHAQQSNSEKIIGCWKIKSVEIIEEMDKEEAEEIRNGALGMIICLDGKGKFSTTMPPEKGGAVVGTGIYKLEADGKTLTQSRDVEDEDVDLPAEIIKLTDKSLSLKIEYMIIHYERVEEKK